MIFGRSINTTQLTVRGACKLAFQYSIGLPELAKQRSIHYNMDKYSGSMGKCFKLSKSLLHNCTVIGNNDNYV